MAQFVDTLDLATLDLRPGEGRRVDGRVRMRPLEIAGQTYEIVGGAIDIDVDVSRTVSGYVIRLRFEARLEGACMRCLEPARPLIALDLREVDEPGAGEEARSPYLADEQLDLASWSHDMLALALPVRLLCSESCRGLCPVCGANLNNEDPELHRHERGADPRWAKLRELEMD